MAIEIPGDMLEGGGQIVRTSVALSALLEKSIHVVNVRAKRTPPGLKAQHLTGVKAVADLSKAECSGLDIGSTEFTFEPKARLTGQFRFDVGTAGSIPLVLQALMPASAFAPDKLEIEVTGGTDVRWSPTIDYMRFVKLPMLAKMGYQAQLKVLRRGHYPKGGGRVVMAINPTRRLEKIQLTDQDGIRRIRGLSHCVKLPKHVAERQLNVAESALRKAGYADARIDLEWYEAANNHHLGPGSGIALYAETGSGAIIGADAIGERGKPAENVGLEAVEKLIAEVKSGTPVDRHLADMLIPYMAVAKGTSKILTSEITLHTLTNIRITELVAEVKFKVTGELGKPGSIEVEGIGLTL
jgi:RNA 3'-terminal phosphate cyclase (ATP)